MGRRDRGVDLAGAEDEWIEHGAGFQARSCRLALRLGEPERVACALATEATYLSLRGGSARRCNSILTRARRIASSGVVTDRRRPFWIPSSVCSIECLIDGVAEGIGADAAHRVDPRAFFAGGSGAR